MLLPATDACLQAAILTRRSPVHCLRTAVMMAASGGGDVEKLPEHARWSHGDGELPANRQSPQPHKMRCRHRPGPCPGPFGPRPSGRGA